MKKTIIWINFILVFLICGCSSTHTTDGFGKYEYKQQEICYFEKNDTYSFRMNMELKETKYAKCFFEPSIEYCERNACIKKTDEILSRQIYTDTLSSIYVFDQSTYNDIYIFENSLFNPIRDWESVKIHGNVMIYF